MDSIIGILQGIVFFVLAAAIVLAVLTKLAKNENTEEVKGAAYTQSSEGWSVGGDLKDGTWCYAPEEAKDDDPSILVLRDTPKIRAIVDGKEIDLRGGFRGFRDIPPGQHEIQIFGYNEGEAPAVAKVDIPPGGCMVLIFEPGPNRLEPDRVYGVQYIPLALSGAMDSALFPFED